MKPKSPLPTEIVRKCLKELGLKQYLTKFRLTPGDTYDFEGPDIHGRMKVKGTLVTLSGNYRVGPIGKSFKGEFRLTPVLEVGVVDLKPVQTGK